MGVRLRRGKPSRSNGPLVAVLSAKAERSRNLVNLALADYRQQTGSTPVLLTTTGLTRRGPFRRAVSQKFRSHDALLRLVAIAEDYSVGQLIDVTEARLSSNSIVQALWDSELERSGETWARRLDLWRSYYKVEIRSSFSAYAELRGFIEARNAIAHGLGELSRKQQRDRARTIGRLANANIQLHGNALVITSLHVERCAVVVGSFIEWLDPFRNPSRLKFCCVGS
jgi:hypothetical protein